MGVNARAYALELERLLQKHRTLFWFSRFVPLRKRAKFMAMFTRTNVCRWHDILYRI